jgi:type II secretory pathway pseudopilin PulG
MSIFRWLLASQLKQSKKQKQIAGFTLIELLVAMILAILVITPLLGFMINIMDTDRQEQVKATTEQEIQTALDYIARDLQQALYVYDADGINAIKASLPGSSATDNKVPVLVFWKREFDKGGKTYGSGSTAIIDDNFKYSLVAYYVIKGNDSNNNIWSKAVRIGRFQLIEGDAGFTVFSTSNASTLREKMNAWTSDPTAYRKTIVPLVDNIDQTALTATPTCPNFTSNSPSTTQLVPASTAVDTLGGIVGFYACVESIASDNKSVVQVYLRGNALARIYDDEAKIAYRDNVSSYFPQTNVRVQGRSFLFNK